MTSEATETAVIRPIKRRPVTFQEMLRYARREQRLTQREFAKWLKISATYLSDMESGRRAPSVRFVKTLCMTLLLGPMTKTRPWHEAGARAHGWEV